MGASTTEEHGITPGAATPHVSSAHSFSMDLQTGEAVKVTITWEGPAASDLDLDLSGPSGICVVTDVECMAGTAEPTAQALACQSSTRGETANVVDRTETARWTATEQGTWTLYVMASAGIPGEVIPYDLTVKTGGHGADTLRGPGGTTLIRDDSHCRTPDLVPAD